jgi:hypothetical protein
MELYINPEWKKIGISLSGGADSALLAYLVCLNTDAEIHIVTQVRNWKSRPWQRHISIEVFDWLVNKFPKNKFIRHEGFIPPEMEEPNTTYIKDEYGQLKSGNRIILRSHNEFIIHNYKLDAWYSAVTKNPIIDIPGALEERNEGVLPVRMKHMGIDILHPFVYTMKDWIIKQYFQYKIDDLLEITRSCEGDNNTRPEVFLELDYRTYKSGQLVPICGRCFWCKERAWAFENAK